jgi:hypothetical protein
VLAHVALEVHAHEPGHLEEARVDPPQRPGVAQGHGGDHVLLEPFERLGVGQLVDLGGVDPGVDRTGHEGEALRLGRVVARPPSAPWPPARPGRAGRRPARGPRARCTRGRRSPGRCSRRGGSCRARARRHGRCASPSRRRRDRAGASARWPGAGSRSARPGRSPAAPSVGDRPRPWRSGGGRRTGWRRRSPPARAAPRRPRSPTSMPKGGRSWVSRERSIIS